MAITITPAPMPIAFTLANNAGKPNADQSSTDPISHTSESKSESSHLHLSRDHQLVEEEALRILARSKRRKLDDIPARERWRCPNESCGREYKRTSTTSIGHHRETCPHRPILKARALLQLNPQQLAIHNVSHLNPMYGNQLLSEQHLQLLQQQAHQLNIQPMNMFANNQPTVATTASTIQPQISHAPTHGHGMMVNLSSMINPNDNALYPSMPLPLQSSMVSVPSLNYLPMSNSFGSLSTSNSTVRSTSAFNPVFSNASNPVPIVAANSPMALNNHSNVNSISFQNQMSGISAFSVPTQASVASSPMDISNHTSNTTQTSSTGSVTLVKPIARRRVDPIPSLSMSSSSSIVTTPHESPRSLYFTGSAFSFPLQKLPANPFGEK